MKTRKPLLIQLSGRKPTWLTEEAGAVPDVLRETLLLALQSTIWCCF